MSTAKYIAERINIKLNVDERLGERKFGVKNISDLPDDFFDEQFRNWDYKLSNGESANDVSKRMNEALSEISGKPYERLLTYVDTASYIDDALLGCKKACCIHNGLWRRRGLENHQRRT